MSWAGPIGQVSLRYPVSVLCDQYYCLLGPGTLTMSSITAAVAHNLYNYNKVHKRGTPGYYSTVPADVEIFTVPDHLRAENQKYSAPPSVIGSPCASQYDCGSARGAVCAADTTCKGGDNCISKPS